MCRAIGQTPGTFNVIAGLSPNVEARWRQGGLLPIVQFCDREYSPQLQAQVLLDSVLNTECPVCLEELRGRTVVLTCHLHAVCRDCCNDLRLCPLCRNDGVFGNAVLPIYAHVDELRAIVRDVPVNFQSARVAFEQVDFTQAIEFTPLEQRSIERSINGIRAILQQDSRPWWKVWRIKEYQRYFNLPDQSFPGYREFQTIMQRHRLDLQDKVAQRLPGNFTWQALEFVMQ